MNKKILTVLMLCTALFVSACSKKDDNLDTLGKIKQRGKIIVGVKYDTKPFGYINENQELVGFDVDLAKSIAKNILGDENKIEFKQVTPSNRILALNSNQVDMIIATMTITPERKAVINFSSPYYMAGQAVLVPKDSKINAITDLNGKRVIIVFGSTSEKNLRIIAPNASIIGFKTYTSGFEALKQGRADALTSDDSILLGLAMDDQTVRLLPKRYTREPYGVGFKKDVSSQRLEECVNNILAGMKSSGELNQIKNKWIKY